MSQHPALRSNSQGIRPELRARQEARRKLLQYLEHQLLSHSTAFMLVGVVGSNKSATTKNVFGTAESPNVIKGGSITLGGAKVTMTAENYLTYALPWGTGKSVNASISSNTIWHRNRNVAYILIGIKL